MYAQRLNREDIYQALKKEVGEKEKEVSEKINEILYEALFKNKKKVFLEQ